MRRLLVALGLFALSCGGGSGRGVKVTVHFDSFVPGCLELSADDGAGHRQSGTVARARFAAKDKAVLALSLDPKSGTALEVKLRAFEDACTGEPVEAQVTTLSLQDKVTEWDLTLASRDGDGDGFVAKGATGNGTDCDDTDRMRNPGAPELCGGSVDLDCDGKAGCSDSNCLDKTCDDGNACTSNDVCTSTGSCSGAPKLCDQPPNGCFQPMGVCGAAGLCSYQVTLAAPCGDAGVCFSDGTCRTGEANCLNGTDDDQDTFIDCADSDCLMQTCDDANACTDTDRCVSLNACSGAPRVCNSPPAGPCFADAGTCVLGACVYPAATGRVCDDQNGCTSGDSCQSDAGCGGGVATVCTADGGCIASSNCEPSTGSCVSTFSDAGSPCSDGNLCSFSDVCNGAGTCSGTGYTCPELLCAAPAPMCLGDGGCAYLLLDAGVCGDGGVCTGGTCVPNGGFPFLPQHFAPAQLSPGAPFVVPAPCLVLIDTTDAGMTASMPDGGVFCAQSVPAPTLTVLPQPDAGPLMVMLTRSLSVAQGATLLFRGQRAAVVAVYGDADIDGQLAASSGVLALGAGGRESTACGSGAGLNGPSAPAAGGGAGAATNGGHGGNSSNSAGLAWPWTFGMPLVGGCRGGGAGGFVFNPGVAVHGSGGFGGGGLQLSVAGLLRVGALGRLSVSGGGGSRGLGNVVNDQGGGGGGSGGVLVLESWRFGIAPGGALTSNGGAGAGGSDNGSTATNGGNGPVASAQVALGGLDDNGGKGGDGGSLLAAPRSGESSSKGGGGGGASVGFIWVVQHSTDGGCGLDGGAVPGSAIVSPAANYRGCP